MTQLALQFILIRFIEEHLPLSMTFSWHSNLRDDYLCCLLLIREGKVSADRLVALVLGLPSSPSQQGLEDQEGEETKQDYTQ